MILEVLQYILLVLGIVVVGALIVWGLVTIVLKIIEPNGNKSTGDTYNNQITYENYQSQKLIANEPVATETVAEQQSVAPVEEPAEKVEDVDLDKAKEEEEALSGSSSFDKLSEEEDEFIREKQRAIEERMANKAKEEDEEVDEIFVDEDEDENDEDIESLINKILDGEDVEENTEAETEEAEKTEEAEEVDDTQEISEVEEEPAQEETEEIVAEEETAEEEEADADEEAKDQRIKELEAELARQKEEYEAKLREAEENTSVEERPTGSVEEYEARLEVLKERLKANEKELKTVKKDFIPLYRINKTLERDNIKLRRKEALVAKQKVVLYGVNNYVDIDEEKAKKLREDLDLLEGLRLSVQHCEEVMKENEDRYPILESSYNSLMATNNNIKEDIKDCTDKIEALKLAQENDDTDAE